MRELILTDIKNFESFENFQYPGLEYNSSGKLKGKVFIKWDQQHNKLFFVQLSKFERILRRVFGYYSSFNRENLSNYIASPEREHKDKSVLFTVSEYKDQFRTKASRYFKGWIDSSNTSSKGPNEKDSRFTVIKKPLILEKKSISNEDFVDFYWKGRIGLNPLNPFYHYQHQEKVKLPPKIIELLPRVNFLHTYASTSRSDYTKDIKHWKKLIPERQGLSLPFVVVTIRCCDDNIDTYQPPEQSLAELKKEFNIKKFYFLELHYHKSSTDDGYSFYAEATDAKSNIGRIKALNHALSD